MAWSKYQLILAAAMIITGSLNTLSTKWADRMTSRNSAGDLKPFDHPFLQACGMFLGEILCLLAFKLLFLWAFCKKDTNPEHLRNLRGNQDFNPLIFLPAAMCDMCATSIMYVGLNLTYAASFQMFRGSVIVFTALLSVAFLGRDLSWREWGGIYAIISGLVVVGVSDFLLGSPSGESLNKNNVITGDELIILAQIITASQMVYEEKFISKYNVPPLQAVGWEGVFGFLVLALLQIPFYFIYVGEPFSGNARGVLEDVLDGFIQLSNNPLLICAFLGTIISIAFFNFAGISVTKEMSATTRMVLDSVRTLVIWMVSLALHWQGFHWLQVVGFILLIGGMWVYNDERIVPTTMSLLRHARLLRRSSSVEVLSRSADEEEAERRLHHGVAPIVSANARPGDELNFSNA
ncbi:solute carrier family 35 member F6 [Ischnura elegans]|uniref:solute carrier family 35 member F6 n=1 Tax=Ischnura elegans TaxID=197161 RepID=UPI001ED8A2BC|nr:solute carrier family 35 member F6 [Ischnura elegans]